MILPVCINEVWAASDTSLALPSGLCTIGLVWEMIGRLVVRRDVSLSGDNGAPKVWLLHVLAPGLFTSPGPGMWCQLKFVQLGKKSKLGQ